MGNISKGNCFSLRIRYFLDNCVFIFLPYYSLSFEVLRICIFLGFLVNLFLLCFGLRKPQLYRFRPTFLGGFDYLVIVHLSARLGFWVCTKCICKLPIPYSCWLYKLYACLLMNSISCFSCCRWLALSYLVDSMLLW